jgi:hypothetical protein
MRGPLKFLTILALPFTGLVANAFPTPDNRFDISIAITENGGDFTPSENHLITGEFGSTRPLEFNPLFATHADAKYSSRIHGV